MRLSADIITSNHHYSRCKVYNCLIFDIIKLVLVAITSKLVQQWWQMQLQWYTIRVRHMWFRTVGVRDIGKEGLRLVVVGGSVRGRQGTSYLMLLLGFGGDVRLERMKFHHYNTRYLSTNIDNRLKFPQKQFVTFPKPHYQPLPPHSPNSK